MARRRWFEVRYLRSSAEDMNELQPLGRQNYFPKAQGIRLKS